MIEIPEALNRAEELSQAICGRTVTAVSPPTKTHKFCWFNGDVEAYGEKLIGKAVRSADGFGIFVELAFSDNRFLCVNDGVNMRLVCANEAPKDYQLLISFDDGTALVFTVAMYGGIILHDGDYANEYYLSSRNALSPFDEGFEEYFFKTLAASKPNLSAKAFLATQQRFPGIGNGVLQDILFAAAINPKRKISTFSQAESKKLFDCTVSVLHEMTNAGGRDTEKNIRGISGGYQTKMSKNSLAGGCPVCGGEIKKEAYLGGSVYYCPSCQKI